MDISTCELFRAAAIIGQLHVINRLKETNTNADLLIMIRANSYTAFAEAARGGHLAVMNRIIALAPTEVLSMVKTSFYYPFVWAAYGGHLAVIERLMAIAPGEVQNMHKAREYQALRYTIHNGHLPAMEKLITLAPDEVPNIIKFNNYCAFRQAVRGGHLPILKKLITLVPPADGLEMIQNHNYIALKNAAEHGHIHVVNWLLSLSTVLAYAESHEYEFNPITRPFITDKLSSLRSQRFAMEAANPHAVFDLADAEEIKCCFYNRRITHFIDELAHIGRAHNWDHRRSKVSSSGHTIEEEYDDLTGDKPSCFSGVKRRLFQSVIGHPLLTMLTEQDIKQELRDFVRAHFARLITDENKGALLHAWTNYCGSAELVDAEPLRVLDISAEQQAAFIQQLTAKYGRQFSDDPRLKRMIDSTFKLVESTANPSDCMHALKFDGIANLSQLLQVSPIATAGAGVPASTIGFFAGTAEQSEKPLSTSLLKVTHLSPSTCESLTKT